MSRLDENADVRHNNALFLNIHRVRYTADE